MNAIDKLAALARREHDADCRQYTIQIDGQAKKMLDCSCPADEHNAAVDALLAEMGEVRVIPAMPSDGHRLSRGAYLVIEIKEAP